MVSALPKISAGANPVITGPSVKIREKLPVMDWQAMIRQHAREMASVSIRTPATVLLDTVVLIVSWPLIQTEPATASPGMIRLYVQEKEPVLHRMNADVILSGIVVLMIVE